MIPDIEVQLQVIAKSLKDNVAPAIDPANQLAGEQMHLSIAALEITLAHLPYVHGFLREDIEIHIAIAEQIMPFLKEKSVDLELSTVITAARLALGDPSRGFTCLQKEARALREAVSSIVREYKDESDIDILHGLVLELSAASIKIGRSWNKLNGFEPRPNEVPELSDLLD